MTLFERLQISSVFFGPMAAIGLVFSVSLAQYRETCKEIDKIQSSLSDIRKAMDSMDEKIRLERQDSYSSFEDLRERFAQKNFEVAKLTHEKEMRRSKK
jgi:hypothetical protein